MVKFDVVTFGSGVVDVFASTDVMEKRGKLDLEVGSKYLIDGLRFDVGGGATNTATAFARFGFKTGCICGVGKDSNGQEVLDCLKKEGVKFLGKVGDGKTGYSMIVDSRKNNRTILTYKGESNDVSTGDVKKFKSKWIYYSSLLGKSFVAQRRLAAKMVGGGVRLTFNPSSYSIERQNIRGLLRLSYVLILNKEEAVSLAKRYYKSRKKLGLLEKLHSLGPKIVVVTDKNKIVKCYDGEKVYSVKPHSGVKVVERTGAGDAFAAGFVSGMMAGFEMEKCLELGVSESEAVLGHFGAKNDLIRRKLG
jgi:ribokinase